jgi:hypothetical protein
MPSVTRLALTVAALGAFAVKLPAQSAFTLPFAVGERLVYDGRVRGIGGRGTMWIAGPVEVRGVQTYELHFDFFARIGPLSVSQKSTSWLDPEHMAALRFEKRERHLLVRREESVEMFPDERRWSARNGDVGASPSSAPLDELSFIYFVRTLQLTSDSTLRFSRHFDADRSPTLVRLVGREQLSTPAGTFNTVVVEMRVRDPQHYKGEGTIRFSISDDRCRLPVRIESNIPDAGNVVLTLADVGADTACAAHLARR